MRSFHFSILLGFVTASGIASAQAPAEKAEPKKVAQKEKYERGKLVTFKDSTLTIQSNSGVSLVNKTTENTKALVWNHDENKFMPMATAEALTQAKPGTWMVVVIVNDNIATIRIGARRAITIGSFVSFKENRLLILGKNLGESYTKKYGDNVHFNKFRDDVPVYESIDGGEYKLVQGSPAKLLPNVKEGTIITIHGEGDDNITKIQIGVPKK